MASMEELYRIAMMNEERANAFPNSLASGLEQFSKGYETQKTYDEGAIERAAKVLQLQDMLRGQQVSQAAFADMFPEESASMSNTNQAKTAKLFEEMAGSGEKGRMVAGMLKDAASITPSIRSDYNFEMSEKGQAGIKPKPAAKQYAKLPFYHKRTGEALDKYYMGEVGSEPKFIDPDGGGDQRFSASTEKDRRDSVRDIYTTVNANKLTRERARNAMAAIDRIPTGMAGKIGIAVLKNVDPSNPMLADWQTIKSLLTNAQLQYVAKTKGAVSDKEMDLFAQAAANDEIHSKERLGTVLTALVDAMDADELSKIDAHTQIFNDDPATWNRLGYSRPNTDGVNKAQSRIKNKYNLE
jgi:hypothetical protein